MSDDQRDVLLGWAFGDTLPGTSGVMVSILVRTWKDGHAVEGIRDPLLIDREILESLDDGLPQVLDLMESRGMASSGPEPARTPLQWNAGVRFDRRIAAHLHMCTMFGFYDPDPIHGAAIARIETKYVRDKSSEPEAADYLVPFQSIQDMRESLGRFLRDSRDGTEIPTGSAAELPQFDFGRLKLRYDARTRKVRMNRAYLGEYLRCIGVMSLPGQSDLVDLLAKLYLLNRKQGMAAIADVDAFLKANGMSFVEHDPETIGAARRAMDGRMDAVLLQALSMSRQASSPKAFWRWVDDQVAPIAAEARAAGETAAFEKRYGEILQLAKDAGIGRPH